MRDPWDVLGVKRGASFEEVRDRFHKLAKRYHPDRKGPEADEERMKELNVAYEAILLDIKETAERRQQRPHQGQAGQENRRRQEAPRQDEPEWRDVPPQGQRRSTAEDDRVWEKYYRDIDEELENLRRAAEDREDRLRTMRARAWEAGHRSAWLAFTWQDLIRFIRSLLRSGLKGVALIVAALMGVGSVLAQLNLASALIVTGSLVGFFVSVALKNDKGGVISAGLLLFGLMTLWLPPVRAALFGYPVATISVLLCLALIFKFARELGVVGLLTAGVLGAFVIGAVMSDVERQQIAAIRTAPLPSAPLPSAPPPSQPTPSRPQPPPPGSTIPRTPASLPTPPPPPPPEPRTLRATKGAVLKFVAGVPYILEIRSGQTTTLRSSQGQAAFYEGGERFDECRTSLDLSMAAGNPPFQRIHPAWAVLRGVTQIVEQCEYGQPYSQCLEASRRGRDRASSPMERGREGADRAGEHVRSASDFGDGAAARDRPLAIAGLAAGPACGVWPVAFGLRSDGGGSRRRPA
jgi:hypothetical protein